MLFVYKNLRKDTKVEAFVKEKRQKLFRLCLLVLWVENADAVDNCASRRLQRNIAVAAHGKGAHGVRCRFCRTVLEGVLSRESACLANRCSYVLYADDVALVAQRNCNGTAVACQHNGILLLV